MSFAFCLIKSCESKFVGTDSDPILENSLSMIMSLCTTISHYDEFEQKIKV